MLESLQAAVVVLFLVQVCSSVRDYTIHCMHPRMRKELIDVESQKPAVLERAAVTLYRGTSTLTCFLTCTRLAFPLTAQLLLLLVILRKLKRNGQKFSKVNVLL